MVHTEIKIHSVAACCNNRGIGNKGNLPWRLPKEHKYFSRLTTGKPPNEKQNVVIMGRKTWDSLPNAFKPLKNRYNIVFSRNSTSVSGAPHAVVTSLNELVTLLRSDAWKDKVHEIFNIGGSEVYKLVHDSPHCGKVYLTRIMADFECDTFMPSMQDFELFPQKLSVEEDEVIEEDNGIQWKVEVYQKK